MPVSARALPILSDNYAWLLRDEATGATAIVDPADAKPCIDAIERDGRRLDLILITHHHDDHIAGVDEVRTRFGARVVGAAADRRRLPRLDQEVTEGDQVKLGESSFAVIDTPGHTLGHISYFSPQGDVLLCADTLFSLGCGRLLEGTAADMFASLQKLARLPGDTLVCCGHEYTQSNARFALHVDPDNAALRRRAAEVDRLRAEGKPTVPSRLADEKAENPFLRAPDVATLADIRRQKDNFR
ncbi:MAG TPA: hydroxyacylglutathione hydrolase [Acetobacteraceae bacterium]|nr:hydroxyacylglutathione hydrolase [Acetobacteraceae bacterium]